MKNSFVNEISAKNLFSVSVLTASNLCTSTYDMNLSVQVFSSFEQTSRVLSHCFFRVKLRLMKRETGQVIL